MLYLLLSLVFSTSFLFAIPYGGHSMIDDLRTVIVKRPDRAFATSNPQLWHYTAVPNLSKAQQEHDDFVAILKQYNVNVMYHDEFLPELADAIFVHDPIIMTDYGAVILRMGKSLRFQETEAFENKLVSLHIPILGKLLDDATAEGGDCLWLDQSTLAVGKGFRTNEQGIQQLKKLLKRINVNVIPVELPYYQGADACLHLQSLISIVDNKTAVIYRPLLTVSFIKELEKRGFKLIDVPEQEFLTMGPNILAIKPGVCLTIEGNPITKKLMEDAGIIVHTYKGDEISLKAEGGATCLTRPVYRHL